MKIFHAGLTWTVIQKYQMIYPDSRPNDLLSYGRPDRNNTAVMFKNRAKVGKIMLDSGTWTYNQNPQKYKYKITFPGYMAYLSRMAGRIDYYFNFDLDFSADGFDTNIEYQQELEEAGYRPIPVIHDCYGNEIQYYIDAGYDYVAIGSGELRGSLELLQPIVARLHEKCIRVHFLGSTDFEKLAYTPAYSSDSSSWSQAGTRRRGHINFWNPMKSGYDKSENVFLDHKFLATYRFLGIFEEYLHEKLNMDIDDLIDPSLPMKIRILNRQVANLHYFMEIEQIIKVKHAEQGFVFE
jgi:hypothetical protein